MQAKRRLKRRAPLIVCLVGLLAIYLFCKLTGKLAWIDWAEVLFFGSLIETLWQVTHHFRDANEKKEAPPPSQEVLAMAADSMTKLAAIREYRKESRLGFKEARRAIEAQLASPAVVQ